MKTHPQLTAPTGIIAGILGVLAALTCPPILGFLITNDGSLDPPVLQTVCWLISGFLVAVVITLLLSPPGFRRRLQAVILNSALVFSATGLTLGAVEVGMRLWPRAPQEIHSINHEYEYRTVINSDGFRGDALIAERTQGTFRALAIGDSFIDGIGVSDQYTIPKLLESYLSTHTECQIEVLSIAAPGANTYDYISYAKRFSEFRPDLVILAIYVDNDIEQYPPPAPIPHFLRNLELAKVADRLMRVANQGISSSEHGAQPDFPQVDRSYLDLVRAGQINPYLIPRGAVGDNHAYYAMLTERFTSHPYTKNNILAVARVFDDVPFLLVILPSKYQVSAKYFASMRKLGFEFSRDEPVSDLLQQEIQAWAQSVSLSVLDTLPGLMAEEDVAHYFEIDDHLNSDGTQRVAALISNWIVNNGKIAQREINCPGHQNQ